ncbi:MAG: lipoate--protein ligase family protein [bacterium]|nr:MAG: lipoate--protein ligase family protein [bacterium]
MANWFLLDDGAASGATNMARDEFLLRLVMAGGGPPILRIYQFYPPAITIGYHQDPRKVLDMEAVGRDHLDLVRRFTGGRALLHAGELTYCVIGPEGAGGFGSSLRGAYLAISRAVVEGLRRIGVDARISAGYAGNREEGLASPCLVSASRYEVTAGARKIVGSAQRRTGGNFLQHGSILLHAASGAIVEYLRGEWESLEERITSVSREIGRDIRAGEVRYALREAFAERFNVTFEPLELSEEMEEEIARRSREKAGEFASLLGREVSC